MSEPHGIPRNSKLHDANQQARAAAIEILRLSTGNTGPVSGAVTVTIANGTCAISYRVDPTAILSGSVN